MPDNALRVSTRMKSQVWCCFWHNQRCPDAITQACGAFLASFAGPAILHAAVSFFIAPWRSLAAVSANSVPL